MVRELGLAAMVKSGAGPATLTLSNVAVQSVPSACEHVARPTNADAAMVMFVEPWLTQVTPSAERNAVSVLPTRVRRTQYGALKVTMLLLVAAVAAALRRTKVAVPPGVIAINTSLESAASVSRI